MTKDQIELPLRDYVDIDRDGWVSLSYPYRTGAFIAHFQRAHELVKSALSIPARHRKTAIREVEQYLAAVLEKNDLITRQWDEFMDRRRKGMADAA